MKLWDTCSWKGQLEKTRSLKGLSSKVWSWKELIEVGKLLLKLENSVFNFIDSFQVQSKFPTYSVINFSCSFQVQPELWPELSNFGPSFPTSARTLQLRREVSNFILSDFISDFSTSLFPTALSNYSFTKTLIQHVWYFRIWLTMEGNLRVLEIENDQKNKDIIKILRKTHSNNGFLWFWVKNDGNNFKSWTACTWTACTWTCTNSSFITDQY